MLERCNDCAFTRGTNANKSELTKIKIGLCLDTDEPFDCHVRPGLCAGFEAAYPNHKELLPWQKKVSEKLLEVIADAEEGRVDFTKTDIAEYLRTAIKGIEA